MTINSELEKHNLEVHVDLCQHRYDTMNQRLTKIEDKVEEIHKEITKGNNDLSKVIIGSVGSLLAGVISLIIVLIMTSGK